MREMREMGEEEGWLDYESDNADVNDNDNSINDNAVVHNNGKLIQVC